MELDCAVLNALDRLTDLQLSGGGCKKDLPEPLPFCVVQLEWPDGQTKLAVTSLEVDKASGEKKLALRFNEHEADARKQNGKTSMMFFSNLPSGTACHTLAPLIPTSRIVEAAKLVCGMKEDAFAVMLLQRTNKYKAREISTPRRELNLEGLNSSQADAVHHFIQMKSGVMAIKGPPGTFTCILSRIWILAYLADLLPPPPSTHTRQPTLLHHRPKPLIGTGKTTTIVRMVEEWFRVLAPAPQPATPTEQDPFAASSVKTAEDVVAACLPTPAEGAARRELFAQLGAVIRTLFAGCQVKTYGSSGSAFGGKGSDLDIVVITKEYMLALCSSASALPAQSCGALGSKKSAGEDGQPTKQRQPHTHTIDKPRACIQTLAAHLKQDHTDEFTIIEAVVFAHVRVPLLKLRHKSTSIEIDVTVSFTQILDPKPPFSPPQPAVLTLILTFYSSTSCCRSTTPSY